MIDFSKKITNWYSANKRQLPWRDTQDPFKIWLSEIILQQTRVDQGMAYYIKFTNRFSTPSELAEADLDEVLKLWQGLGYYSRARNLYQAATYIKEELNGTFPKTYSEIIKLKGVGEYTAAAISSFAFGENHAVVDGNVFRVLSRVFGIETPIDSTSGKKEFKQLAYSVIDEQNPAEHNQAIMEFGATFCTPKKPNCLECIFSINCQAYLNDTVSLLPIKEKKIKQKDRFFYYLMLSDEPDTIIINKRTDKDIWENLYQFPLIESKSELSPEKLSEYLSTELRGTNYTIEKISTDYRHVLSHQVLHTKFITLTLSEKLSQDVLNKKRWIKISKSEFDTFAVPRLIDKYIEQNGI